MQSIKSLYDVSSTVGQHDLVLGLDVSTAVTGVCVITTSLIPVYMGFIDTRAIDGLWNVADSIIAGLTELSTMCQIRQLYVEEDLRRFRSGFSTAETLTTLSKINGIVTYSSRGIFRTEPLYVKSSLARTKRGIKLVKAKTPTERRDPLWVKRQVFTHVSNVEPLFKTLQWPSTRPTKKNPCGRMRDECFDMVDAYVVAWAGACGVHNT